MKRTYLERLRASRVQREASGTSDDRREREVREQREADEYQARERRSVLQTIQEEHVEMWSEMQAVVNRQVRIREMLEYLRVIEEGDVLDEDGRRIPIRQFLRARAAGRIGVGPGSGSGPSDPIREASDSEPESLGPLPCTPPRPDVVRPVVEVTPRAATRGGSDEVPESGVVAEGRRRPRASSKPDEVVRLSDGTYSWRVLKDNDVPNVLEEVAVKLSATPVVLELSNEAETSDQVAERWVRSKHYSRDWKEAFVRAREGALSVRRALSRGDGNRSS